MSQITAMYEQSLLDGTTQKFDWSSEAQKIVNQINNVQKPEAEKIEKGKAVSLIKQVLTQVQDQNLKAQYADITNENITEDQIKSFFNILTLVKKEIDDPTDLPPLEGIIGFRERGPDTIPPYIRTLTTKYKNSTNLIDLFEDWPAILLPAPEFISNEINDTSYHQNLMFFLKAKR